MVTLAIAIIPNEDTNDIAWFIQLCALHGINFDCALFTDRGHIISAVRQLTLTTNLKFNLMFCLQHLKRNVWHKFPALKEPPMNEKVKTLLEKAAKAETSTKFLDSFFEFLSFVITTQGSTMAMDVAQYLLSIDPSHWTIMANNKRMFCSEIHSKHVNQLFHHLTAAVKLEQHLSPGNDDNGWIHDMDDMQLAQKILEFENMSVEDAPHVTQVLFNNFRKCPCCGENKNNVAKSIGGKCLCNCVCLPKGQKHRTIFSCGLPIRIMLGACQAPQHGSCVLLGLLLASFWWTSFWWPWQAASSPAAP